MDRNRAYDESNQTVANDQESQTSHSDGGAYNDHGHSGQLKTSHPSPISHDRNILFLFFCVGGKCFIRNESRGKFRSDSPRHPIRNSAKNPFHHSQMFSIIMRLKERDTQIKLKHYAADRPDVTWLRPAQL